MTNAMVFLSWWVLFLPTEGGSLLMHFPAWSGFLMLATLIQRLQWETTLGFFDPWMSHDLRPLGSSVVNNRFSVKLASSCFTSYLTAGQNRVLSSTDALIKSQSEQELHLWGLGACPAGKATSILLAEPVEEASELTFKKATHWFKCVLVVLHLSRILSLPSWVPNAFSLFPTGWSLIFLSCLCCWLSGATYNLPCDLKLQLCVF